VEVDAVIRLDQLLNPSIDFGRTEGMIVKLGHFDPLSKMLLTRCRRSVLVFSVNVLNRCGWAPAIEGGAGIRYRHV
jgi:hypothetical protein